MQDRIQLPRMRDKALTLLVKQIDEIRREHELKIESEETFLAASRAALLQQYDDTGWQACIDLIEHHEHYIEIFGLAKRIELQNPQFITIRLNGQIMFECFIADVPRKTGTIMPACLNGFCVIIDRSHFRKSLNVISVDDPDNGAVIAFRLICI